MRIKCGCESEYDCDCGLNEHGKGGDGTMKQLLAAIENDVDAEGVIGNCRWIFYPTTRDDEYCGTISLADASNFDRWANSRIVDVHTVTWSKGDPDFEVFIQGLMGLFGEES